MPSQNEHLQHGSSASQPDGGEADLSKDTIFHLLQNERRRRVLELVADGEGPFVMRDLAEQVAAWEHDTTIDQLSSNERQRVYIALYQSHLPKLDDNGVIEYNQSRGRIETTDRTETVLQYLDRGGSTREPVTPDPPARWRPALGGMAVASVCLTALSWPGLRVLSPVVALGSIVLALAGLSGLVYLDATAE